MIRSLSGRLFSLSEAKKILKMAEKEFKKLFR